MSYSLRPRTAGLLGQAEAAGFALKEQSTTAQGNAFAGATAGADDISYMYFNPAALGLLERDVELQAVTSVIVPRIRLQNASATTGAGTPIAGSVPGRDVGDDKVTAAIYGAMRLGQDWRVGVGINAPFGLGTDYPDSWVGRYHAIDSDVKAIGVTPTLAYTLMHGLTFGAGLQLSYAQASLSNAVDFGTIGAGAGIPGSQPGAQDGFARVDGDDWGAGYTLGVLAEPIAGTRVGIGHRSKIDHRLKGDADFSLRGSATGGAISAATGAFQDTGAAADLESSGLDIDRHPPGGHPAPRGHGRGRLDTMEQLQRAARRVRQPGPARQRHRAQLAGQLVPGARRHLRGARHLTLRVGVAYDQTPVREAYSTPRIPDGDRTWLSLGIGWTPKPWLSLDAALTHIFVEDTAVRLQAADPDNASRGDLDADYESSIDLIAFSARVRF